jgi:lipopolysaccharide biosynthesis protein
LATEPIRPIAIHLPQFHPIPENDLWWGKGFTEWTNVTKARPLFKGHYQPHLPADLGFYDLRLEESRIAQAELAKEHGIYGFCYYHYWFNGKQLLQRPVEEILNTGKPDFPFMLCWANENWTRVWNGSEHEILMKQEYSEEDAVAHCEVLLNYFKDDRYIKINNRPVFAIYNPVHIIEIESYLNTFKSHASKHNINLYLCAFETFNRLHVPVLNRNFDAAVEFQPHSQYLLSFINKKLGQKAKKNNIRDIYSKLLKRLNKNYYEDLLHNIKYRLDYNEYVDFVLAHHSYPNDYKRFPGITPMWDNTARRGKKSFMLMNENPLKFKEWMLYHKNNFKPFSKDENFIFVNAWNEWAEGNHLEPCQKWGRKYLEAVKDVFVNS